MMSTKGTRNDLSLADKYQVIKLLDQKMPQTQIAEKMGCSQAQVSRISTNRASIIEKIESGKNPERKRYCAGKDADVDSALSSWFTNHKSKELPVSERILKEKASELAKQLKKDFKPSSGWVSRWKQRNNISFKKKRRQVQISSNNMANPKPMGIIEGYQVFSNEGHAEVKQEPVDPEYEQGNKKTDQEIVQTEGDSGKIRSLLMKMVENQSKELTVKSVVESLLHENEMLLAQNDAQALKPHPRKQKTITDDPSPNSSGSILAPKDPTIICSGKDLPNVHEALVEVAVSETNQSNCDPDLVCAIGSKIMLMTSQGQALQVDITYYWCNFCSFKSEKKEVLLQHVMEHRFHCKYCKFQSFSRAAVILHCTEEHESFAETAMTLKYCTYLPDLLERNELNKRKKSWGDGDAPSAKRARSENAGMPDGADGETSKTKHLAKQISSENLPVISNVMSGQQAVSAAISTSNTTTNQPNPKPPTTVTVSSGLCWNCGYCGFVTLSQSFLKIHLNAQHQGKAHKYVAMLVSSEEEMARIKASDAQLVLNPSSCGIVPVNLVKSPLASGTGRTTLPAPTPKKTTAPGIEIDNAESDSPVKKTVEETEEERRIPVSYKCAHCNFSAPQDEKVKVHLFQRHNGCVIYALDMKAVKLRQKRYIFFCLKTNCDFQTKETEEYLDHIAECTPWLDGVATGVDPGLVKSLELTKNFIEKTASGVGFGKDTRPQKSLAEYACVYCAYLSNNNTRVKKHVTTNHPDRATIIKDLQASRAKKTSSIYFCNQCLWETKDGSILEMHIIERHNANSSRDESDATLMNTEGESDSQSSTALSEKTEEEKKVSGTRSGRKRRNIRPIIEDSDSMSAEEQDDSATSADDGDIDNSNDTSSEYDGIVPANIYERAMKLYIEHENPEPKKRGRPTRNAAVKCRIKVKSAKAPPLYKCLHCDTVHFGTKLMRSHIRSSHKDAALRGIDVLKQHKNIPNIYVCFCPSEKCDYAEVFPTDVVNHAKNKHNIASTHADLVYIMQTFKGPQTSPSTSHSGRPSTAATGESYECLYCSTSKMYHSRRDMKKHLLDQHTGEEFVFRDCVARKLRQPSRVYMCHSFGCDFTNERQKDYLLHMLGHQKAKIYECSKCLWFTSVEDEIDSHLTTVHANENVTTLAIDLDLDAHGNTVKLVGGTLIKAEKN